MSANARLIYLRRAAMTWRHAVLALAVLGTIAYGGIDGAQARGGAKPPSKLDRLLRQAADAHDTKAQRVIVRVRPGRAEIIAERLSKHGDRVHAKHARVQSITATVHGADLEALAADPDIENVSVDAVMKADAVAENAITESVAQSGNLLRNALGLTETPYTGDKVGIAVIDSGLEKSEDLDGARADRFFDFTAGGEARHPYDDFGHGTHVATLIAGEGRDSRVDVDVYENGKPHRMPTEPYEGIASKARIISLKVLDREGAGYTSAVLSALEFAVENREKLKIDIINLSLGHPIYEAPETDPLVRAVEDAVRAGIVVVASAGNYGINPDTGAPGYAGITSPGNAPSAITVGAFDMHDTAGRGDDTVAPYSSRGPAWYSGLAKPDLVAPGHRLVAVGAYNSALYERYSERRVWGRGSNKQARYLRLSGTSMAAAVTTGVIALMIEANRDAHLGALAPNAVKAILEYTALPLASADVLTQGTGGLNGAGAITMAERVDTRLPPGAWWLTNPVTPSSSIDGQSYAWSQAVVWGNYVVWGNLLFENQMAWGQYVVWGNAVVWGNYVVWGNTDLVWDNPALWSQYVVWGNTMVGTTDGSSVLSPTTVVWGNIYQ
jgi:serine protease AprX